MLSCYPRSTVGVLPLELVAVIVDWNDDNVQTLRSCSLVSRAWAPFAQSHIFRTVKLTPGAGRKHSRFIKALEKSPQIATYVHHFSINTLYYTPNRLLTVLTTLLSKLVNLRSCHLNLSQVLQDDQMRSLSRGKILAATKLTILTICYTTVSDTTAAIRQDRLYAAIIGDALSQAWTLRRLILYITYIYPDQRNVLVMEEILDPIRRTSSAGRSLEVTVMCERSLDRDSLKPIRDTVRMMESMKRVKLRLLSDL